MEEKARGTVYILSAASGTGKTSLAKALALSMPNMKISISHTTRSKRTGELADKDYFFITRETFEPMIEQEVFLEHAKVYNDYYGTSRLWVEEQIASGIDVILDIDWQGAAQIRKHFSCVSIFLLPPSREELRRRLEARKRDTASIIERRLALASAEISHCSEYDYIVINDKFDIALGDLLAVVRAQRLLKAKQAVRFADLIAELQQ